MMIGMYAPKPNMGASTVARQLALALASRAEPVLLVELDYRFPSTALCWQLTDEERSLERAVSDYLQKPTWRLSDYVLPGRGHSEQQAAEGRFPPGLSVLLPSGLRGFESFPPEPQTFVGDLADQAKDLAFSWVVMDLPSEVDSVLFITALKRLDLCILLSDGSLAHEILLRQRLELWNQLGLCAKRIRVRYPVKPVPRMTRFQMLPELAVAFPYVRRMPAQGMRLCNSRTYRKALHQLIRTIREKGEKG